MNAIEKNSSCAMHSKPTGASASTSQDRKWSSPATDEKILQHKEELCKDEKENEQLLVSLNN